MSDPGPRVLEPGGVAGRLDHERREDVVLGPLAGLEIDEDDRAADRAGGEQFGIAADREVQDIYLGAGH